MSVFKPARYFDPVKIAELKPLASDIDKLNVFPFLTLSAIASLKGELPQHLAISADLSPDVNRVEWWKRHEDLPNWSKVCKMKLLLQPSSAAADHNSFNDRQVSSLQDYIETSVMLQTT